MDEAEQTALLIIVVILFLIVLLIEFKFFRKKDRTRKVPSASMERDRAFNAMHTAKAVRNKLKAEGYEVLKAEYMIEKADSAFASRQYAICMDFCDKAKDELIKCRREGAVFSDTDETASSETDDAEGRPEMHPDEVKEVVRTSGGLYLQARFELTAAKDELQKFDGADDKRASATDHVSEAERLFDSGEYQKSLSSSFKARKILSGEGEVEPDAQAEAMAAIKKCPNCSEAISEGDLFCFACGCSLRERRCSSCGAEMRSTDKFCRICGVKS